MGQGLVLAHLGSLLVTVGNLTYICISDNRGQNVLHEDSITTGMKREEEIRTEEEARREAMNEALHKTCAYICIYIYLFIHFFRYL